MGQSRGVLTCTSLPYLQGVSLAEDDYDNKLEKKVEIFGYLPVLTVLSDATSTRSLRVFEDGITGELKK